MLLLKGIVAYVVSTFAVQATSHFAINRGHYAAVPFLRTEPVFALGLLAMIIQGALLTYFYSRHAGTAGGWKRGWAFGVTAGAFFVSYSVLAEPAKYTVPSIPSWMLVEGVAGFVQFSLFGVALGWLCRPTSRQTLAVDRR
jgi:hypothetical protein